MTFSRKGHELPADRPKVGSSIPFVFLQKRIDTTSLNCYIDIAQCSWTARPDHPPTSETEKWSDNLRRLWCQKTCVTC